MNDRLALLFASTALSVVLGVPAFAAIQVESRPAAICGAGACAAVFGDQSPDAALVRVSGDEGCEDDDEEDDDEEEDEDDDEEEDDDGCMGARGMGVGSTGTRGNAAPAGTVAPPANGLFGNGAPPVAVTN